MSEDRKPLFGDSVPEDFEAMDSSERNVFIKKVYSILMTMLLFTIGVCLIFREVTPIKVWTDDTSHVNAILWPCFAGSLVTILMIACIPRSRFSYPCNYIILFMFNLFMSVMMALVTNMYDTDSVLLAFGCTCLITFSLTVFAFQTKWDFTRWGPYLLCVLIGLIFMGIVMIWYHNRIVTAVCSAIGAIVFSLYIVYDTQLMIGGKHHNRIGTNEHVFAALSLYLDILNLFLYLLRLIGLVKG